MAQVSTASKDAKADRGTKPAARLSIPQIAPASKNLPPAAGLQQVLDDRRSANPAEILTLQRQAGNRAVTHLLQPKLKISANRIQRKFIVAGAEKNDAGVNAWIADNAPERPDIAAVVRMWARDDAYTTDHENDGAAYVAADAEVKKKVAGQNAVIGARITMNNPPLAVAWGDYPIWAAWYFNGLEYQNNQTNGWHANKLNLLPGGATVQGRPTRYVEFRRPGAVGTKDVDKMERCIFDLLSGRCWPNAHYDHGYVEITDVPAAVKARLLNEALTATGMQERRKRMTATEKAQAGTGFALIQWLLQTLEAETPQ